MITPPTQRVVLALLILAGLPVACQKDDQTPSGTPVSAETFPQFVTRLDAALALAVTSYLDQVDPRTAPAAGRTAHETPATVEIPGVVGKARVGGELFALHAPARFELTIEFQDYGAGTQLRLEGDVQFNFVVDEQVSPGVIRGLYRGTLALGGDYRGAIRVQGMSIGGTSTALRLTGDGVDLLQGGAPPAFLTYVSTIAGTGTAGAADGPGAAAMFDAPTGIAVDDEGRIYVADHDNSAIREIALDGAVSTLPTTGEWTLQEPSDLGFDSKGKLVVSDELNHGHGSDDTPLLRLDVRGDDRGTITPIIRGTGNHLNSPFPLCPIATLHSCDGRSPLSSLPWAKGIDVRNQSVLVAQWALGAGLKLVLPDGYVMTAADLAYVDTTVCDEAHPGAPHDLAQGNTGEIYFTTACHAVRVFQPDGTIRTLAGRLQRELEFADGAGDAARFSYPAGIVFDGERYLFVADSTNRLIRRVDIETGEALRIAGCLDHTEGFECDYGIGFRDGPGDHAQFERPVNLAIDRWGDLFVVDAGSCAVRMVRIITDPVRTPAVHRFDPAVMQQGDVGTLTLSGRNLTTLESIDLGDGVTATITRTGYQHATATVTVAAGAEPGPRSLTVRTSFGEFTTPQGLLFTVVAGTRGGIRVETIAGTGSAAPDRLNYGPARNTTFAFPGGMHAISQDRLLIADPVEHRIRLIATRVGAVEEFFELLVYAASGTGVDPLGGILGIFDGLQQTLDRFGLGSGIIGQGEDALRDVAEAAVDDLCSTLGADGCTWLSLPWAGLPYVPGEDNGFRLGATFFLPTDIWADPAPFGVNSRYYISDSGNSTLRVVGYDAEHDRPAPMQIFSTDDQPGYPFAVTPENMSVYASLPSSMTLSQLSLNSGAVNPPDYATLPRGVPLGIATYDGSGTDDRSIFVADPLNATIWRVVNKGGVAEVKNLRGDVPSFVIGQCVDGPATFATWGAPMDVAVDQTGTVYVADAGCNSIRVIQDAGFGQDLDGLVGSLREFVASNQSRISAAAAQRIEENLRLADTQFIDDNRFMVTTLAGSTDGQPGFADGPAALARFDSPTSIALASTGAGKVIFVGDTGNRRIRHIKIP